MRASLIYSVLLYFIAAPAFAQDPQKHFFDEQYASVHHIRSVTIYTCFQANKDSMKLDTGVVEKQFYDEKGKISRSDYNVHLDKSTYHSTSNYYYSSDGNTTHCVTIDNAGTDSTVTYDAMNSISYREHETVIRQLKNDSLFTEIIIRGTDTTFRRRIVHEKKNNLPFDENYRGTYSKKEVYHDAVHSTDSTCYYDTNGKLIVSVTDHLDQHGNIIRKDYYNFGDKNYIGFSERYNAQMNMNDYILIKKNRSSYHSSRTYNEKGLLIRNKMTSAQVHFTPVILIYTYEYY